MTSCHYSIVSKKRSKNIPWNKRIRKSRNNPDSKVHRAIMGPLWVLSAPDGPCVGPMNLAIREAMVEINCISLDDSTCKNCVSLVRYWNPCHHFVGSLKPLGLFILCSYLNVIFMKTSPDVTTVQSTVDVSYHRSWAWSALEPVCPEPDELCADYAGDVGFGSTGDLLSRTKWLLVIVYLTAGCQGL